MSIRNALINTLVAGSLVAASTPAFAKGGTDEQRNACMGDAFRLCGRHIPDEDAITKCMKQNFSKLSPGCKAVFGK